MARDRLRQLMLRLAPEDGRFDTALPGLQLFRTSCPSTPMHVIYRPSLCVVGQGRKRAILEDRAYTYDAASYLVLAMTLPVKAQVLDASPERPFVSLSLGVDLAMVNELLLELGPAGLPPRVGAGAGRTIAVSALDEALDDALVRLLEALAARETTRIVAPLAYREVLYRVLAQEQGDVLRAAASEDGNTRKVARAIRFVEAHFAEKHDVAAIASVAGMSASALHREFKRVTSLSPLQYVKRLRLHQARVLMLTEGCTASQAAFRVGYESPSQFSREFKRLFGETPTGAILQRQAG